MLIESKSDAHSVSYLPVRLSRGGTENDSLHWIPPQQESGSLTMLCMYTHLCIHTYTYTHIYIYLIYIYTLYILYIIYILYIHTYIDTHIYMYTHTYTYTDTHTDIYIYIFVVIGRVLNIRNNTASVNLMIK